MMDPNIKKALQRLVADFRLPRYGELPQMGLYLEQVTKYINGFLARLGCAEMTISMISNYVKKGFIPSPQKKQYDADSIAYLIFIAITKNVLSLDNIVALFDMQRESYTLPMAYDYFCSELENMLGFIFGLKPVPEENLGVLPLNCEKDLLRNVIVSASHSLYLTACFAEMKRRADQNPTEDHGE